MMFFWGGRWRWLRAIALGLGTSASLGLGLPVSGFAAPLPAPQFSAQQPAADPLPSGWQRLEGASGVAIALPSHFQGGNPKTDFAAIAAQLQSVVPDADRRLDSIRANLESFALVAFDSELDAVGFLTNLNIAIDTIPTGISTEQMLQVTAQTLARQSEIVAQELVEINAETGGRLLAQSRNADVQQLFYLFVREERLYVVVYSASSDQFAEQLSVFEQSIRTFEF